MLFHYVSRQIRNNMANKDMQFDYHYAQIYIPEKYSYHDDKTNTDMCKNGCLDHNSYDMDIVLINDLISQFLKNFPKHPVDPTFLLPQSIKAQKISRWQSFASKKGIKKRRKEIYDTKEDTFLPTRGRFKMSKEILEKQTKKKKGIEKRTCANERFIRRY